MKKNYKLSYVIHYHRKDRGLTQKQLADLAGVGKTVIFDIEKGKESVQFNTLCKVLKVLDISIHFESPLAKEFLKLKS